MATALPFPIHKHPPTQVQPLGLLDGSLPGLPADQGESAPNEETPIEDAAPSEEAVQATDGESTEEADGQPTSPPPGGDIGPL